MAKEEPKPIKTKLLNEEAMKGVWVDGVGIHIGLDYVILEGVVSKPRSDKPYIVSRMMFPPRVLQVLVRELNKVLEEYEKRLKEPRKKVKVEKSIVE